MQASAWNDGKNTYGIRVGKPNRDRFFSRHWRAIQVEIDGRFYSFALTSGFWRDCPEFRDHGEPVIREWLQRHRSLSWPYRQPPTMELIPLGDSKFRIVP